MVESSRLFSPQKKKIKPSKLAGATIYKGTPNLDEEKNFLKVK